jgi:hypothetical protein
MSDNEIPPDVLEQARQAGEGMREALNAPVTGEPVQQAEPDLPPDMSNVPDPYDVQGQEVYRAEQREHAVSDNDEIRVDAKIERDAAEAAPPSAMVSTPVGDLSEADYDAMLDAGMALKNADTRLDMQTADASAPQETGPTQDIDIDLQPTPEPQAPEPEPGA